MATSYSQGGDLPPITVDLMHPDLLNNFAAYTPEYQAAVLERLKPAIQKQVREAYMGMGRGYSGEAAGAEANILSQVARDLAIQGAQAQTEERHRQEDKQTVKDEQKKQIRGETVNTALNAGGQAAGMYLWSHPGGGALTPSGLKSLIPNSVKAGWGSPAGIPAAPAAAPAAIPGIFSPPAAAPGPWATGYGAVPEPTATPLGTRAGFGMGQLANGAVNLGAGYAGYKLAGKNFGDTKGFGDEVDSGIGGAAGYVLSGGNPMGTAAGAWAGRGLNRLAQNLPQSARQFSTPGNIAQTTTRFVSNPGKTIKKAFKKIF